MGGCSMAHLVTATRTGITGWVETSGGQLVLGQTGRSRREVRVAVDPSLGDRPEVGAVVRQGDRVSLVPGRAGDAVVVRVRTEAAYTRGCPGRIRVGPGWSLVAEGLTAWGGAGNLGVMPDVLLAVRGDAEGVCQLTFSGGRRKGGGTRWLVAVQRGCDWPSVLLIDCHPDAVPDLRPAAVLLEGEAARVLGMIRALGGDREVLEHAERALGASGPPMVW